MKICRKCNKPKPKQEFYANNICRSCGGIFPKQLITSIYSAQKYTSKRRELPLPKYTLAEFRSWILKQPNFRPLYITWLKQGKNKWLKPSVDRIKEWEGYSLDNIQLMTWAENKAKGELDCKEGRRYKIINQVCSFDLESEELCNQYFSAHEAERQTGIKHNTINSAMNQSRKHNGIRKGKGGSLKWMYLLDFITNTIQDIEGVPKNLSINKIHHSHIHFNEDTCLVSIQ